MASSIRRILIANRGEIARRVIHTARRLGIETVAVHSAPDADALHVQEADRAVALGGAAAVEGYLRIERLIDAARASGADAVHPGYGFLSENADFAQAVLGAGLTWIGPPPAAIRALGSKSAAKALAAQHGVPCLAGYAGADQSDARFQAEAARIGFPVMVKAAAGGGGRGMRLVHAADQLAAALASARSESAASFGSDELLIERALLNPRHVEVQVFADAHGQAVHLGERDCSVQRHHQKIIEESPSPAVDEALRERMGACALALARAAGYVGAGTVEFLLDGAEFFLMEMNTRLQVEHPVTEALTGLDLVEWQIRVARGEPLPLTQTEVRRSGHAIEVRLCAEDEQFRPHTGRVHHLALPPGTAFEPGPLRIDHALAPGTEVGPHYDAMLGKLIVHAPTRAEAIDRLIDALGRTQVLGLVTNRAMLAACLDHPRFRSGQAPISFLHDGADGLRQKLLKAEQEVETTCRPLPVFASNVAALPSPFERPLRLRHRGAVHALRVREAAPGHLVWSGDSSCGERALRLERRAEGQLVCLRDDGTRIAVRVVPVGDGRWHLQAGAVDWWVDDAPLDPPGAEGQGDGATELRAVFNGRVVRVAAQAGQVLAAGDVALVIESMKLEHSVCTPRAARVAEILVAAGQQVAPGQLLIRFAAEAP